MDGNVFPFSGFPQKGNLVSGQNPSIHAAGNKIGQQVGIDGIVEMGIIIRIRITHGAHPCLGKAVRDGELARVGCADLLLRLHVNVVLFKECLRAQHPVGVWVDHGEDGDRIRNRLPVSIYETVAADKLSALVFPVPGGQLEILA